MNKFQKAYYIIFFFLGWLVCILAFFMVDAPSIWLRIGRLLLTLILFNGFIYVAYKVHGKIAKLIKNNKM